MSSSATVECTCLAVLLRNSVGRWRTQRRIHQATSAAPRSWADVRENCIRRPATLRIRPKGTLRSPSCGSLPRGGEQTFSLHGPSTPRGFVTSPFCRPKPEDYQASGAHQASKIGTAVRAFFARDRPWPMTAHHLTQPHMPEPHRLTHATRGEASQ